MKESKSDSRSFTRRINEYIADEANAVQLKLALFSFSAGAICVFPFFVLQMQLLGMTIQEIAVVFLVVPLASLAGPLASGLIADKLGRYSVVLALNIVLCIFFFDLLLLVPAVPKSSITFMRGQSPAYDLLFNDCQTCVNNTDVLAFQISNCKWANNSRADICFTSIGGTDCLDLQTVSFNTTGDSMRSCGLELVSAVSGNETVNLECLPDSPVTCSVDNPSTCQDELSTEYSRSFYLFLICKFVGNLFASAAFTMADASMLALAQRHNLDVGRQKIMSLMGFAVAPIFSGVLIDYHSQYIGYRSYASAFVLGSILMAAAAGLIIGMDIKVDKESDDLWGNLKKLVTHSEILLFLIVMLILGTNFGFIESYIFIYLQSLGAPGMLLGLTLTVGCLSSMPMLYYAAAVERKLGRQNIYLICFTMYAVRMVGYSLIYDPWMGLIFETLEAFTYQLMWITSLKLCPILAPKGLLATMTGCTGAIHYSFGKGIGGFAGGYVIKYVGIRVAFRIFAGLALFGGVFYFIIHHCALKEKIEKREAQIKQEVDDKFAKTALLKSDQNSEEKPPVDHYSSLMGLAGPGSHIPVTGLEFSEDLHEDQQILRRVHTSMPHLDVEPTSYNDNGYFSRSTANLK